MEGPGQDWERWVRESTEVGQEGRGSFLGEGSDRPQSGTEPENRRDRGIQPELPSSSAFDLHGM